MAKQRKGQSNEHAELVYGWRAGLAVFARRRDDIIRVAYAREGGRGRDARAANETSRQELSALVHWATSRRVPCVEMSEGEIDRFAESTHHEGLCVATHPRRWLSTGELADALGRVGATGLALDRVRNPYNVGAMMRTAAFFGLPTALLGAPAPHPGLDPAAVRVAEGGVEHLKLARTTDLADTLARLRARGVCIVGADGRSGTSSFAFRGPALLVMGNEREGLGDRVRAQCDALVAVPGGGAVESLNVAVAAGILLAEMVKTQKSPADDHSSTAPRGGPP